MKRINLRDVPDDVYAALAQAAEENRQSLSAFVVEQLAEMARTARLSEYVHAFPAPENTGITLHDVVDAVQQARKAS